MIEVIDISEAFVTSGPEEVLGWKIADGLVRIVTELENLVDDGYEVDRIDGTNIILDNRENEETWKCNDPDCGYKQDADDESIDEKFDDFIETILSDSSEFPTECNDPDCECHEDDSESWTTDEKPETLLPSISQKIDEIHAHIDALWDEIERLDDALCFTPAPTDIRFGGSD